LQQGAVGLNLSPLMARYLGASTGFDRESMAHWREAAVGIAQAVLEAVPAPLLLVPHVTSDSGKLLWRDDYLFLREVEQHLHQPERVTLLPPTLNAGQTKWAISRLNMFAGARTHSTIAAISSNVPTVCIGYSMKARGISKDVFGSLDWLVDGKHVVENPSLLSDRLGELLKHQATLRQHLEKTTPLFRKRAKDVAEQLAAQVRI
jgi:colanic acid/amylovoran biosynthesis protein